MFSERLTETTRRKFLQLSAAGVGAASMSGWLEVLAHRASAAAPAPSGKAKSCILMWMDGGPSHKDTFDLKPGSKGAGDFKPIATSAPGIEISEHLPKIVVERIYLATLSRKPTAAEIARLTTYISGAATKQEAYADILWVALNSSEFTMIK